MLVTVAQQTRKPVLAVHYNSRLGFSKRNYQTETIIYQDLKKRKKKQSKKDYAVSGPTELQHT